MLIFIINISDMHDLKKANFISKLSFSRGSCKIRLSEERAQYNRYPGRAPFLRLALLHPPGEHRAWV